MAKQSKKQKALSIKLGDNQKLYGIDEAIQERCPWLNCGATPELPTPVTDPSPCRWSSP